MELWRSFQEVVLKPSVVLAVFALSLGMAVAAERWPGFPTPYYYPPPASAGSLMTSMSRSYTGEVKTVQVGPDALGLPGPGWTFHASGTVTNKIIMLGNPEPRVRIENGQSVTNFVAVSRETNEVLVWMEHVYVDGEAGWKRRVRFNPLDNSYEVLPTMKCDPKDLDPKYSEVMAQVDKEVEAEMKRNGDADKPGAKLHFWRLKKEKLKAQNIEWKSPAELNPGVKFD